MHSAAASNEVVAGIRVIYIVFMADDSKHKLDKGGGVEGLLRTVNKLLLLADRGGGPNTNLQLGLSRNAGRRLNLKSGEEGGALGESIRLGLGNTTCFVSLNALSNACQICEIPQWALA